MVGWLEFVITATKSQNDTDSLTKSYIIQTQIFWLSSYSICYCNSQKQCHKHVLQSR